MIAGRAGTFQLIKVTIFSHGGGILLLKSLLNTIQISKREIITFCKLYAVRWIVGCVVEGHSVWKRHITSMVEDNQYGLVIPSVQRRHTINMAEGVQYSGGYVVWICHIFSTTEGVQYGPCHIICTAEGVLYRTTEIAQRIVGGCFIW